MRRSTALTALAALGMSSAAIAAEGVSHTFAEAGYGYAEVASGAIEGDGFKVDGSLQLPANVIVAASYRDFDYSQGGSDAGLWELSAGLGYKWALGDSFDLVTGASFEHIDVDGDSEGGFGLNLGARGMVSSNVELSAGLQYRDISQLPSSFTVSVGVRRYFTPAFAAGIDVRKSDFVVFSSETSFIATLRYDFGQLFQ